MFATAPTTTSTKTSIIFAAAVAIAALAGQVLFLDQQIAGPLTASMPSGRIELVEEMTVRAPAPLVVATR